MEWHDHWAAGRRGRWSELHPDVKLEHGPTLARLRSRHGAVEHFLLRRYGGALQMAEVPKAEGEHQRLRYALLAAAGNPAKFRLARQADGFIEVSVPRILPGSEAMVLAALARALTDPDEWEQVFRLPGSAGPQVERMLMRLGLVRSDAA